MSSSASSDHPNEPSKVAEGVPLDEVLTALQKSFSRVSAAAATVPESDALSLISGPISFSMSIKVQPNGDRLIAKPDGEVALSLSGAIHQDIRVKSDRAS